MRTLVYGQVIAPDPFAVLGIEPGFALDVEALGERHRELSRALHPDRYSGSAPGERRLALGKAIEVNKAFALLKNPVERALALLARRGVEVDEDQGLPADQEFLIEIMELREELSRLDMLRDGAPFERLKADVSARRARTLAELERLFARLPEEPDESALAPVLGRVGELRYLDRFLDEAFAIEDARGT